jgi:hypothetical protein
VSQTEALQARLMKEMPNVSMMIRAVGKEFGCGLDPYVKGQGMKFKEWLSTKVGVKHIHALLRMVGSRNDVYWENALMVYYFMDLYVEFLVDERQVRWGADNKSELNRLQSDLLSQLTCLPLKIGLRGRAVWFYVVYDPLRYISGSNTVSATVLGMGPIWRRLGQFIDQVSLDGSILADRERCESLFIDLVPSVATWRAKKMERPSYLHPVERVWEADETDCFMKDYHEAISENQKTKHAAMCVDYYPGGKLYESTPELIRKTRMTSIKNCSVERLHAVAKMVITKMAPGISLPAGQAIAMAIYNKHFVRGGVWDSWPDDWKEIAITYCRSQATNEKNRQVAIVAKHLEVMLKSRQVNRDRQEEKESGRIVEAARLANVGQVPDAAAVIAGLAAIVKKHGVHSIGRQKEFLKDQVRIQTKLYGNRDVTVPFSVKDLTRTTKSKRRLLDVSELLAAVLEMIKVTAPLEELQLTPAVLHRNTILDDTVLPRTLLGRGLMDAQLHKREAQLGISIDGLHLSSVFSCSCPLSPLSLSLSLSLSILYSLSLSPTPLSLFSVSLVSLFSLSFSALSLLSLSSLSLCMSLHTHPIDLQAPCYGC